VFGGTTFVAKTEEDFEKVKKIAEANFVDLSHAPGGGKMVSIRTPTNNLLSEREREDDNKPSLPRSCSSIINTELHSTNTTQYLGVKHRQVYMLLYGDSRNENSPQSPPKTIKATQMKNSTRVLGKPSDLYIISTRSSLMLTRQSQANSSDLNMAWHQFINSVILVTGIYPRCLTKTSNSTH
jgi:hypothetical protein